MAMARRWLDVLSQDVRYAQRALRRTPGFTGVVVITLALGIGACTAIFSVVQAVLVRSLPYRDADRFVRLLVRPPGPLGNYATDLVPAGIDPTQLEALRSPVSPFTHLGVYVPSTMTLTLPEEAVRLNGQRLSPDVLAMLGEAPLLGRLFERREEAPGLERVVILSYTAWQHYFNGRDDILGQVLTLDGNGYTVIGVMRAGFAFPDVDTRFWIPFVWPDRARLVVTGRLRDGATLVGATDAINIILRGVPQPGPMRTPPPPPPPPVAGAAPAMGLPVPPTPSPAAPQVRPGPPAASNPAGPADARPRSIFQLARLQEQVVASVRPALLILSTAVGFVLLIACVNVANLVLARGAARRGEMAMRMALGASRARLIGQTLTESMLLSLAAGVMGTGLAFAGLRALQTLGAALPRRGIAPSFSVPQLDQAGIDGSVLLFTLLLSMLTGVLFGLVPALRQAQAARIVPVRERGRGALVVIEIALAMLLFLGAGLLLRSFVKLSSVDPGFDAAGVLTFQVALPSASPHASIAFRDALVARLAALPGVRAAACADQLPMAPSRGAIPLRKTPELPGGPPPPPPTASTTRPPQFPDLRVISADFPRAMGMAIVEGRGFGDSDRAGQAQVMLINRTLARSGLFGPHPIGQRIYAVGPIAWEIIGIVEDARQIGLDQEPGPQVFIDIRQMPTAATGSLAQPYFVVRTDGSPAAMTSSVRGIVRQVNPQATLDSVATMAQIVSSSLARPRVYTALLAIFAAVAVLLAAVGIYGVMSYAVTQRTREIGIRMALGAARGDVLKMVLGQSLIVIGLGVLAGVIGGVAVTGSLAGLLFGVTSRDPATFVAASLAFAAIAIGAAFLPAHRAAKVDPLIALRYE